MLLNSGCGDPIKIHDDEFCADAGPYGGRCFTLLSDRKRVIPPDVWNSMPGPDMSPSPDSRFGRISGTAETFGHLKANVLKLCQVSGDCSEDEIKKVQAIQQNLEATQRLINLARKKMVQ